MHTSSYKCNWELQHYISTVSKQDKHYVHSRKFSEKNRMGSFATNVLNVSGQTASEVGQDNALFLTILLITMGINLLIIAALIVDTQTNQAVRVILVNLLLSGVVSSIAVVIHDFIVMLVGYNYTGALWQAVVVVFYFGGSARLLFATMYAVTIFLLVKYCDKPITKPKSTKYFIVTAVAIWFVAFSSASPLISSDVTFGTPSADRICNCSLYPIIFVTTHSIVFSISPAIFSFTILIGTVCYHKYNTVADKANDKVLKGLIKFGLFLLVVQVLNVATHVVIPVMYINLQHKLFDDTFFSFRSVFDGVHLSAIPTPAFILIFFKPARDTLTRWLTCTLLCQRCTRANPPASHSFRLSDTASTTIVSKNTLSRINSNH